MPENDFSNVEAVVVDSQMHSLRLVREMLARLSIKKVEVFDSVDNALAFMATSAPDLLLVDCDGPLEADAFRMVRAIRNELTVQNPYATIIITTWQPTQAHVIRTTNCGADDMLVKPFSPRQILDRINNAADGRRRFVVTSDFVGPDRRKQPREGTQVPLIDIPNTLRLKMIGNYAQSNSRQLIADANALINDQKRIRASIQIGFLVEFAFRGLKRTPPDKIALDHIARIPAIVDDLAKRLRDEERHFAEKEGRIIKMLAEKIKAETETPCPTETDKLRDVTIQLIQGIDPDRSRDAIEREIRTAVAAYSSRLEAMAQAKAAAAASAAAAAAAAAATAASAPAVAAPVKTD